VEPAESINTLEVVLRSLVRVVLGERWSKHVDVPELEQRRTEEVKRRDGAVVDNDLLQYTHLYELRKIIHKEWASFHAALPDKKRFDVYIDRAEDFRNAPMHSRILLPFEAALLEGIVGEIRNEVTVYRSQKGQDMNYHPTIDSITDSYGISDSAPEDIFNHTELRLNVGDVIQFRCRGWDPQDRELRWDLRVAGKPYAQETGADAIVTWTVEEGHVSDATDVTIYMSSSGQYHRRGTYDALSIFRYAIDPPE
jgi:hypothetical protein